MFAVGFDFDVHIDLFLHNMGLIEIGGHYELFIYLLTSDLTSGHQRAKVNALDSRGGDELKRQIQADVKENDVT
ncbi:hypothetical protein EYC84_006665 [Monilinia fructicola]|uniref:Uncharacterized protein n=1 Tax=Monilinia fructicola TaxID=38448 RepID=A0A5M9K4M5_MONFR|nr:hypothetical protein EYC84_006665 [Monilinia fructicola]